LAYRHLLLTEDVHLILVTSLTEKPTLHCGSTDFRYILRVSKLGQVIEFRLYLYMLFTGSPFTSNWVEEKGDNSRCERGADTVYRRGSPSLWVTA